MSLAQASQPAFYFAYGSNLSLSQIAQRCPSSPYVAVARLPSYKFIINKRGYANIIPSSSPADEVWGMVYTLTSTDEASLDINEGVPWAYQKVYLELEVGEEVKKVLVYVDGNNVEEGRPWDEYVVRMNRGFVDAIEKGVLEAYVEGLRRFIPRDI